jgi:hypothetical protein
MPISLGHSLNKAVSVSIPLLFGDALPRVCTLVGAEAGGVWLQITDPSFKLFRTDKNRVAQANRNVFVPFAQIAYLLDSAAIANPGSTSGQPTSQTRNPNPAVETRPKRKKVSRGR